MSELRAVQMLPSLGSRDHERLTTHLCSYDSPPERSSHHSSPEWASDAQEGRLPSFQITGRSRYPVDIDSRVQQAPQGRDEPYQSFGGTPNSRPQLPSVSDILGSNSHPQHSYRLSPSDQRVVIEPFERNRPKLSPFLSGVATEERAGPYASPSSNISAPSSASCELESMGDNPRSEIQRRHSTCPQHVVLGPDVGRSFQRRSLCDLNEGSLPSHSDGRRLPVLMRHPPRPYSPEGSVAEAAPLVAGVSPPRSSAMEGHDQYSRGRHGVLPGDGHDNCERIEHERTATSNYRRSATPGMAYHSNHHYDPIGREGFPQLKETLCPHQSAPVTSTPNGGGYTHIGGESSLIWDGNRFLPRLVRTEVVSGEGLCYFYDDGSHCRAMIDGEDVNPSWGVTKAGKPRKRLAVACITCREKKIKCDPDYPKCKQCVKFDRVCMFKNAARAAQILKETYANGSSIGVEDTSQSFRAPSAGQYTESRIDHHSTPEDSPPEIEPGMSRKRKPLLRFDSREPFASGYSQLLMEGGLGQPTKRRRATSPETVFKMLSGALGSGSWSGEFDWETDPYEVYPALVDHLMDLYFKHINSTIYCMFPRKPFRKWLRSGEKSPDDRMLIYAMLTLASRFSTDPDRKTLAKNLQTTAQYAIERRHGKFSLQLVQSRIAYSLYCFAANNSNEAYEYCGAGIRAAFAMRLNVDNGVGDLLDDDTFEYGLNRHAIAECRRRTFWSAYLMDRFNGYSAGRAGLINNDDVFVRLPCHDRLFDDQEGVVGPFFDRAIEDGTSAPQPNQERVSLGPMAILVKISFIWGEVLAEIYRAANRPNGWCAATYETFYSKTQRQLSLWLTDLPPDMVYSKENMGLSAKSGYLGAFLTIHSLYHATKMKLNRYVRVDHLSREQVIENLRQLDKHAREQLDMMTRFRHGLQLEELLGTPFTGYATFSACDVLSAKVPKDKFPEAIKLLLSGLSMLETLQRHWHICKKHRAWILRRIGRVEKLEFSHEHEGVVGSYSLECILQPMESPVCPVDDIAYSADQGIYCEAFAGQLHAENDCEPKGASAGEKVLLLSLLGSGEEGNIEEKARTAD
ncbi:MAG: hypothetical protein M1840_005967 [Geoglossum simile]|nr:MAG: hypothetical protein M1840_005967 [Geoglossum simile]